MFSQDPCLNIRRTQKVFNKYRFKIFKTTTRFKKYKIGKTTHLVRRLPIQLKRKTSFISVSRITSNWALYYLKSKQLNRFTQNIELFTVCSSIASVNVFLKKFFLFQPNNGINLISCSHKIFKKFPQLMSLISFSTNKGPNNLPVLILTTGKFPLNQLSVFDLSNLLYSRNLYPIKSTQNLIPKHLSTTTKPFLIQQEVFKTTATIIPTVKRLITLSILHQNFFK